MGPLSGITVAILAGGLGTRLREALPDRPKVLAVVRGRPFLYHILDQVASFGARRVVLCTGYEGARVEQAVGARYGEMAVAFSREPAPLGTGGALRLALPLLGTDPVMAMNGDSLCAADLGEFLRAHRASRFDISILLARVPDAGRFGTVDLAPDGTIRGFFEKYGEGGPAWINAGAYLVRRGVLEAIPEGRPFSLERDLFPARAGQAMGGHRTGAPFIDIGTPDSLRACEAFLDALHAGEPRPTKE